MLSICGGGEAAMDDGVGTGEAVLEAMPGRSAVAAFGCRLNRSIEWVDDHWSLATGLDVDACVGRDLVDAVADEDRAVLEAAFHRAAFAHSGPLSESTTARVRSDRRPTRSIGSAGSRTP